MKQWAAGVAAVVALVLVMAVSGVTAPQTTLEFWTISLQPFFTDYVNGLVAGYQRANPGVQIKWVDVQFQAVEQKLLAAVAGGVPPDVVNLNVEFMTRIAERGALADMDVLVPAADRTSYFEGLWSWGRYRGRTYGITWYIAPPVLIYKSKLFKK